MQGRIEVTTDELAELIRRCQNVDLVFGPNYAALTYDPEKPLPEAVLRLGVIRGVLTEEEAK